MTQFLLKINCWHHWFEDVRTNYFLLIEESDKLLVIWYYEKLRKKYWDDYDYDIAFEAIKEYITRTLKGTFINDLWTNLYINK